jgi:hypothetical protein
VPSHYRDQALPEREDGQGAHAWIFAKLNLLPAADDNVDVLAVSAPLLRCV